MWTSFEGVRMHDLWSISPLMDVGGWVRGKHVPLQICLVHYIMWLYGNLCGNNWNTVSELFIWYDRCAWLHVAGGLLERQIQETL